MDKLDEIAVRKGVKGSQVALAWILSLSDYVSDLSSFVLVSDH